MKIDIPESLAKKLNFSERDFVEFLSVSLYKAKKINGVEGGHILGISEIEFHGLLDKYGEYVNYDADDYLEDINNLKDF